MSKINVNNPGLYAVKMRASKDTQHLSGAERLVENEQILSVYQSLLRRALTHANGTADAVHLKIEAFDTSAVLKVHSLPAAEIPATNTDEADAILFCFARNKPSTAEFFRLFFPKNSVFSY